MKKWIGAFIFIISVKIVVAQTNKNGAVTYNSYGAKIEKNDAKGKKVTQPVTITSTFNKKYNIDTILTDSIELRAIKSRYRLNVMHRGYFLTSFKAVFGPGKGEKKMEGDKCTPEG